MWRCVHNTLYADRIIIIALLFIIIIVVGKEFCRWRTPRRNTIDNEKCRMGSAGGGGGSGPTR